MSDETTPPFRDCCPACGGRRHRRRPAPAPLGHALAPCMACMGTGVRLARPSPAGRLACLLGRHDEALAPLPARRAPGAAVASLWLCRRCRRDRWQWHAKALACGEAIL